MMIAYFAFHLPFKRVSKLQNVLIVPEATVIGIQGSQKPFIVVTRVEVRLTSGQKKIVDADFVSDCSGRNTLIDDYLQQLGLPQSQLEQVSCDLLVEFIFFFLIFPG